MRTYARWLFGGAALFNVAVGLSLLILLVRVSPILGLDPISGTNLVLLNFAGAMVLLFGFAYLRIAQNPGHSRLLIPYTASGKLLAVASAWAPWIMGAIPARLPMIVTADLVFALLFFDFLRRTRARA